MDKRVHLVISGVVQGVFYRASTRDKALYLGLNGWVRNLPNGDVESVFEGLSEKVDEMIQWCWVGPQNARVDKIEIDSSEKIEGLKGFRIVG
ncbi:MAG: acylphosphatase [Candidatus Altiarchaeota archaeon]|nr:acylphosphatase [Candidatus Altiarchaeota archaeon]